MKSAIVIVLLCSITVRTFARHDNVDTSVKVTTTNPNVRRRPRSELRDNGARFGKKPKKKNLDRDYLIDLLGGGYDMDFLSEEEPAVTSEISSPVALDQDVSLSWTAEHIHKELERLNLSDELLEVDGAQLVANEESLNALKRWLLKKASCPVLYTWKDIGPYFWPRWMKKGVCSLNSKNCSWPSGMYCTPAETTTVQILRWHCPNVGYKGRRHRNGGAAGTKSRGGVRRGSLPDKKRCRWIQVPYPITSACLCRC